MSNHQTSCKPSVNYGEPYFFISYSRKDYYFAESLSYSLGTKGVRTWLDSINLVPGGDWDQQLKDAIDNAAAVILVGSRDSYQSQNVKDEWTRALSHSVPVLIAEFRRAKLPGPLRSAAIVSMASDFDKGISELLIKLNGSEVNIPQARSRSYLRILPFASPDVVIISITLLSPFIYMALEYPRTILESSSSIGEFVIGCLVGYGVMAPFVWFFALSFIRRKMSWRRLLFALGAFGSAFMLNIIEVFTGFVLPTSQGGWRPEPLDLIKPEACFFYAVFAFSLYIATLKQSPDLLRWLPTGTAPDYLRLNAYGPGLPPPAGMAPKFDSISSFYLISDQSEMNLAERLRALLLHRGAREALNESDAEHVLFLVTNNTRISELQNQGTDCLGRAYPVLFTGVKLHQSLDWLWRRQWVDFRTWRIPKPISGLQLPVVPEALTTVKLPAPVRVSYYSMISLAAVLAVLTEYLRGAPVTRLLALFSWLFLIFPLVAFAHLLLTRSLAQHSWRLACLYSVIPAVCASAWGVGIFLFEPEARAQAISVLFILLACCFSCISSGILSSSFLPSIVPFNPVLSRGTLCYSFWNPRTFIVFCLVTIVYRMVFYNILAV